jgi:diacylglycerol kinase family enzyme
MNKTCGVASEVPGRGQTASGRQRISAVIALVAFAAALLVVLNAVWRSPLALLATVATLGIAVLASWYVMTRLGVVRLVALVVVVVAVIATVVLVVTNEYAVLSILGLVAALSIATAAAATALRAPVAPDTSGARRSTAPAHPALLMNPRSGGGKAEQFRLADEARARGIEPITLQPGDDLAQLARDAIERGADALGMAGGDGSQALVASIAAAHDVPYVCVPAGTRNHLALDLGVDRKDVVGALDAFQDGVERRVDLARVGQRVFVNNVSLGLYAEIVQSDQYRDDKVGTTMRRLPELLGPKAQPFSLRYTGPDGAPHESAHLVLVSNNAYELTRLIGLGTRPTMSSGNLGIVTVTVRTSAELAQLVALEASGRLHQFRGFRQWDAERFEIESDDRVQAGVDGEALTFRPPLRFESVPSALRVRVSPAHLERSHVGLLPSGSPVAALARIAIGR